MQVLIARRGAVEILEAPDPVPAEHHLLIRPAFSAVSAGTELSALSQQPAGLLSLIRKGLRSLEKIRASLERRGLRGTLAKAGEKMEEEVPLGYSLAGRVVAVGAAVEGFSAGDWAVAVGPRASHATLVSVPRLMCARLPGPDLARDAACGALAGVGIHAIHRSGLSAGAEAAVFGLGAIGQFTVQALLASGCRVCAFDPLETRRSDAARAGAAAFDPSSFDFERARLSAHGEGVDAVFLCVKAGSAEVMRQAAALCRRRGRLVVVGEFPIELEREAAYRKELEVRVSAAYGEGRYDPAYEELDQDYPVAEGRWTVQRNLQLYVRWLEEGRIRPSLLQPRVIGFKEAPAVYASLGEGGSVLTLISYPENAVPVPVLKWEPRSAASGSAIRIAVVGPGRFAAETHLPNLRHACDKFDLRAVVGRSPARAASVARRFGSAAATCDLSQALADPSLQAVLISTPHIEHAAQALAAVKAGKHVYVEKPLCIHLEELAEIEMALREPVGRPLLFVGFNRRHAPLSQKLREERARRRGPVSIRYHFRALPAPKGEWYEDAAQGGRFVGEACHAVDWILWLAGSPIRSRTVLPGDGGEADIHWQFEDSSRAHLRYQPVAESGGPKESVEIGLGDGRWRAEDFLQLENLAGSGADQWRSKGHREALDAFAAAIAAPPAGADPFGFIASMRQVLEIAEMIRGG